MKYEKILRGKFQLNFSGIAKDFSDYLIGRSFDYSYAEKEDYILFNVKFENDEEYNQTVIFLEHLDRDNNPQTSLDIDGGDAYETDI
jgi:hypothetical protein